jgi:large subunit ribosomal protein L18
MNSKIERKQKRKSRIRKDINGTSDKPRLTVFRSNTHIYAQMIDDEAKLTIFSESDMKLDKKLPKVEIAKLVGKNIGEKAVKGGITKVVFDRNGNMYHGRVKALAEGAREAGLIF